MINCELSMRWVAGSFIRAGYQAGTMDFGKQKLWIPMTWKTSIPRDQGLHLLLTGYFFLFRIISEYLPRPNATTIMLALVTTFFQILNTALCAIVATASICKLKPWDLRRDLDSMICQQFCSSQWKPGRRNQTPDARFAFFGRAFPGNAMNRQYH